MVTLKLFGMNGGSIGKFLPLLKVVRLTAKLSRDTANSMEANKLCLFAFNGVTREFCLPFIGLHWRL